MMNRALIALGMSLSILVTGTARAVPVVSMDEEPRSEATAQELKLGKKTAEAIEEHFNIIHDPALTARVEMIVNRLKPHMQRVLDYNVSIIDHEMVNAFAISGGNMYVATGMLDHVKTDHELAGVIAHEMVHADRKHVIVQTARNSRMTLLAVAAAIASKGHGAAILAANALQVAVMGAYSIDLEKEADARGIDALTKAGYDPVGMLTLQERLSEDEMKRPQLDLGIYQTHPDTRERIAAAESYMKNSGIPVNRKYSLGLLRVRVSHDDGDVLLTIDGSELARAWSSKDTDEIFQKMADVLSNALQLETAPFDVRVQQDRDGRSLFIAGRRVISEHDADGSIDVDVLRERIHAALTDARRSHPMADYFK